MKNKTALLTLTPLLLGANPVEPQSEGHVDVPQIEDMQSTEDMLAFAKTDPCMGISYGIHALEIIEGVQDLSPTILQRANNERIWIDEQGNKFHGKLDEGTGSRIDVQIQFNPNNVGLHFSRIEFEAGNDESSRLLFKIKDSTDSKATIHGNFTTGNTSADFSGTLNELNFNGSSCPSTLDAYLQQLKRVSPTNKKD